MKMEQGPVSQLSTSSCRAPAKHGTRRHGRPDIRQADDRDGKGATPRSTDHLQTKTRSSFLKISSEQVRRCISRSTYRKHFGPDVTRNSGTSVRRSWFAQDKTTVIAFGAMLSSRMTESDTAAAQRLYSILGLTEADIKRYPRGWCDDQEASRRNPSEKKRSDEIHVCEWIRCSPTWWAGRRYVRMARSAD
jgi:hypothetical protein